LSSSHFIAIILLQVASVARLAHVSVQHGEEIQTLQKRITHLETDLEQAKTQLTETNEKLEDANKNLSNVSNRSTLSRARLKTIDADF